ncbi:MULTISPECIES: hypothetical protein [Tsukamurella]|uniref:Pilus assembly protein TadE n=2 Tax=Tsukamurella TaxID=2060 RepID=A0A5C5S487_9ACTN|nr:MULTISPECIES: hypothetical protein [Tsukamurella]NMD55216.1 hypothetical protein [Tsukamurella columbiensis]TWS30237.1 hypothetical protein FK530_06940 [Tsukamurella conjunctivitidis]
MITALIVLIALAVVVQVLCMTTARAAAERAEHAAQAAALNRRHAERAMEVAAEHAVTAGLEARKAQR